MGNAKVKGIVVELGGDATGLSKAISSVSKEARDTQSELKKIDKLLKMDPTNVTLLKQKQELLNQSIEKTEGVVNALKDAKDKADQDMSNGTEVNEKAYRELERQIVANEQALQGVQKEADEVAKKLSSAEGAMAKFSAGAEKLHDAAGKVSSATKGISTASTGVLAGLGAMAVQAGATADDLNTLAKQSGFSTEQLQVWQYGADRVDVAMEDIVSAAAKMKKNMISTSTQVTDAWDRLGVSVVDNNGELRNSTEVFDEVVAALSQVENETERDTLAMTLFGKSADSLAGLLDDGGAAFNAYGEEAKSAGLILSQDALDSANEFNDAVDKLKAQSTGVFAELGTEIATMLIPLMEEIVPVIESVIAWLKGLDDGQIKLIVTILALVAAISPVAGIVSGISGALGSVTSTINGITTILPKVQTAFSSVFSFIAANPIVLLIAAIVALVTLIATKGDEIQALLQKVDAFLQGVFVTDWTEIFGPGLGDILNGFFANLKNIWDSIMQIFNGVIDFVRGVFTGDWERAWNGVKEIFSGIFSGLVNIAKIPINNIIGLLNGAISGLNWLINAANKIPGVNIGTIGSIPYLAKGGTVWSGSAIVGEAGPELLTVEGGKAVVQPLSFNTGKIEGLLGNIDGHLLQNADEPIPIVVQVVLKDKVIGETALNYSRARARANG